MLRVTKSKFNTSSNHSLVVVPGKVTGPVVAKGLMSSFLPSGQYPIATGFKPALQRSMACLRGTGKKELVSVQMSPSSMHVGPLSVTGSKVTEVSWTGGMGTGSACPF